MKTFLGNTTSGTTISGFAGQIIVTKILITNRSASDITTSVYAVFGSTLVAVAPILTLKSGESYYDNNIFNIPEGYNIYISTTASLDYVIVIQ